MLRLMVYDKTDPNGLTLSWWAGARLYKLLGRFDAWTDASSWEEALTWIAGHERTEAIEEIQFWGHGKWGEARVQRDILDEKSLLRGHPHRELLDRIAHRLTNDSLFWFRTCETFGAEKGHSFANALTDVLGCKTAGHTFIIGPWQSGLHSLMPGAKPDWSPEEGIKTGTPTSPGEAYWSWPHRPNTVTCFAGSFPTRW